jgi:predicted Na+-dependent transporter
LEIGEKSGGCGQGGEEMTGIVGGIVLIAVGTIFLLNNLGIAHLSVGEVFRKWWPVILIILGISLFFRKLKK